MPKTKKMHPSAHTIRWFFLLVIAVTLYLFWRIIEPSAAALLTAMIFAVILAPVHDRLKRVVKNEKASILLIILGVLLVVVVPLFAVAVVLVQQASDIVDYLGDGSWLYTFNISTHPLFLQLPAVVQEEVLNVDLVELGKQVAVWARDNIGAAISGTANLVFSTFIFFMALFYFLLDRKQIKQLALDLSPFKDTLDSKILKRIVQTVRSVVFGALIIAVVQAILAMIGLSIFGVPGAILWGALALIAAQIPTIGISLIMVPAIAYLFIVGDTGAAIGLAVWAVVVVGLVDNLLSPLIIGGKTKMNELLILISILGGLQLVGPIGFIVGPTILASVMVVIELYKSGMLER